MYRVGMPNDPSRLPPLVTRMSVTNSRDQSQAVEPGRSKVSYELSRHTGTEDFSGTEVPMVAPRGVEVQVVHTPDQSTFSYPSESVARTGQRFSGEGQHDDAMRQEAQKEGRGKLFGMSHRQGTSTVDLLNSTKEARVHAPALLSLAARDTKQEYGRDLDASNDRSAHSERMVQKLSGRLSQQFADRTATNHMPLLGEGPRSFDVPREEMESPDVSFKSNYDGSVTSHSGVKPGEWEAARQDARTMIRGGEKPKPTPVSVQGRLFHSTKAAPDSET